MLLGLLVASFCVSANAGRELVETSKLDLNPATTALTNLLAAALGPSGAILNLQFTIDLTSVTTPVVMAVRNGLGGTVPLDVVAGVTNKLTTPIPVAVKADRLIRLTLSIDGKETVVPVDLTQVVTLVNSVTQLVTVAVGVVQSTVNGVDTMALTTATGRTITTIVNGLPA